MKLLCLNIGIKIDNTSELINFIDKNNYDIIAMQEVLKARDEKSYGMYRTYNDLEKSFKETYPYSAFAPVWGASKIIKNKQVERDFGGFVEQGCYLLSKNKIVRSSNQFYYKKYKERGYDSTYFKKKDHPRSIQNSIIDINNKKVQIINVHGIWNEDKLHDFRTIRQCKFIIKKAMQNKYPTIIVGDFNLFPEASGIKLMNKVFRNLVKENNIISTRPKFDDGLDIGNIVCDYIFVTKDIKVNSFNVLKDSFSDHFPLELDFEIED